MNLRRTLFTALIFLAVALPVVPLLLWSISEQWFYPALAPQEIGLRAWSYVAGIAGHQILAGLFHSFSLAVVTTLIALVFGLPAGRVMGLYDFPGKQFVVILLLLPIIVPPLSVAMGLHLWFLRLGLTETFTGVVLVHLISSLPYAIFVFWGAFSDYDPDFELQARSLGATRAKTALHIMLPLTLPGIGVAALFSFLLSWSQYLGTLIIGGGKMLTLPILLFALMESGDRPVASAVSLVFVLPSFIALLGGAHYLGRQGLKGMR